MFIIYLIALSTQNKCKDWGSNFYKNQKYRPLEIEKKIIFFSHFNSEIPNFSQMRFSRKCSMFRGSIPLTLKRHNSSQNWNNRNVTHICFQTSNFSVATRSFEIQWNLREMKLPKDWPETNFFKSKNWIFENISLSQ